VIKFARTEDGLYVYKLTADYKNKVAAVNETIPTKKSDEKQLMISTIKENRKGYTQRQFENSKRARRLYHIVGCPTVANFKHILRQNIIKNCPVTADDVNIAEKIFDADIGALNGKNTRSRLTPVKDDLVDIPLELLEQHQDLILCMDNMYLAMVSTHQLNLFPAKGGVSA
jgi:hypothetical protein